MDQKDIQFIDILVRNKLKVIVDESDIIRRLVNQPKLISNIIPPSLNLNTDPLKGAAWLNVTASSFTENANSKF